MLCLTAVLNRSDPAGSRWGVKSVAFTQKWKDYTNKQRASSAALGGSDITLIVSRFMGSRSRPHRVLSVCVCVCVSRCLWVRVIEANSLQLRVITIGLYQFLSRSLYCQILAVFAVVVYGPFWFRDSWALLLPGLRSPDLWLPIASLRYPPMPYGKLRFCLRKAPPLPYGKLRFCLRKAPPLPYGKLRSAYGKLRLCLRRASV